MPSKYRMIVELASQTARDITSNADRYTDFLVTAANNYKYTFKEQLLIYAALFCLEYHKNPHQFKTELRIYQNFNIVVEEPDANDIKTFMNLIQERSQTIMSYLEREGR